MICDRADIFKASVDIGYVEFRASPGKTEPTCLVQQLPKATWCPYGGANLSLLEVSDVLRELEVLGKKFGHFATFITSKLLGLQHTAHICNSEGSTSNVQ